MNKKNIVIASILKPHYDPRHFERFALSLAKTNKYEVNIIANGEKKPDTDQIKFYSNGLFPQNLLQRLILQLTTIHKIIKIKPDVLIICTVELLPFAILYHLFQPCKIIYDIQENYRLNLRHQQEYGWFSKSIGSRILGWIENHSSKFVAHYLLAEKCYSKQLYYVEKKYTILENKTVLLAPLKKELKEPFSGKLKLLFSGTISYYSGIDRIFQLTAQLEENKIDFELVIIGQVINKNIQDSLESLPSKSVRLIIDSQPIPHAQIVDEIQQANLGVIAYKPNTVNEGKIPTKLFEYSTYQLPYLVQKDTHWEMIGHQLGGVIPVDFDAFPVQELMKSIELARRSFKSKDQDQARWKTEEPRLLRLIETLSN